MLSTTDRIPLFVDCIVFKIELFCLLAERWSDRAGGNGTAGMAMAIPVFEGEKMVSLGF